MPKQLMRRVVAWALAAIFLGSLAIAQDNSALIGKWKMQSQTDQAIELKLVAGELDGTWSGGDNSGKTHGVKAT